MTLMNEIYQEIIANAKHDFVACGADQDEIDSDFITDWCRQYAVDHFERYTIYSNMNFETMRRMNCTDWTWINNQYGVNCYSISDVAFYLLLDAWEQGDYEHEFAEETMKVFVNNRHMFH